MVPEYLSEKEVAALLGRSRTWLSKSRQALEREGFPRVDRLIGLTCRRDIVAWIVRRRVVADNSSNIPETSDKLAGVSLDAL